MHLESNLLRSIPGIVHGFGSKSEPVATSLLKSWLELRPTWDQVHSTTVVDVIERNQKAGSTDGFITKTKNPIGVMTADCVPILLARKDGQSVAALHAGWRGTKAKIAEKFIQKILSEGQKPSDWVAAFGPCIHACCYQVSEDLILDFKKSFSHLELDVINPTPRKLDLQAVNYLEFERLGIKDFDLISNCTYCDLDDKGARFHSFRREGSGTRQYSVITRS
jgi:YfiH family protein